jgi:hypothetical protein
MGEPIEPISPTQKRAPPASSLWMRRNVGYRTAAQRKILSNETVSKKFFLNLFSTWQERAARASLLRRMW